METCCTNVSNYGNMLYEDEYGLLWKHVVQGEYRYYGNMLYRVSFGSYGNMSRVSQSKSQNKYFEYVGCTLSNTHHKRVVQRETG